MKKGHEADKFPWKEACIWLLWWGFVALIPVWLKLVIIPIFFKVPTLAHLADKGEFAIYSASLLTVSLYLLSKDVKATIIKGRNVFKPICVACLVMAASLFVGVTTCDYWEVPINVTYIRIFTLILFFVSIVIGFIVTGFDQIRSGFDVLASSEDEKRRLAQQFESSGRQQ